MEWITAFVLLLGNAVAGNTPDLAAASQESSINFLWLDGVISFEIADGADHLLAGRDDDGPNGRRSVSYMYP